MTLDEAAELASVHTEFVRCQVERENCVDDDLGAGNVPFVPTREIFHKAALDGSESLLCFIVVGVRKTLACVKNERK